MKLQLNLILFAMIFFIFQTNWVACYETTSSLNTPSKSSNPDQKCKKEGENWIEGHGCINLAEKCDQEISSMLRQESRLLNTLATIAFSKKGSSPQECIKITANYLTSNYPKASELCGSIKFLDFTQSEDYEFLNIGKIRQDLKISWLGNWDQEISMIETLGDLRDLALKHVKWLTQAKCEKTDWLAQ